MNKNIVIEQTITTSVVTSYIKPGERWLVVTTKAIEELFSSRVKELLEKNNHNIFYLTDYSLDTALELSKKVLNKFDVILSIGGGTVNDVAKLASKYANIRLICIPTIISNDGVCSNTSVLRIDEERTDGFSSKSPDTILVDIGIIKNSPSQYLKAGICDILSNYSAIWDWDLAVSRNKETTNDLARIMSSNAFWTLFNLPENIEEDLRIKIICESIIMSGLAMEIKGNTRPCSGSEHLFNHAMVSLHPEVKVLHGYLVGLGSLTTSIFQKQNFNKLVGFLKRNDIDVRPSTLGISKDVFIDAWMHAKDTRPNRYTILNEIELSFDNLSNIYDKIEKEAF